MTLWIDIRQRTYVKAGVKKHNMYDAPSGIPASGANIRLRFVGFKKKICIAFTQTEVLTGR